MSLSDEERNTLVRYELEKSEQNAKRNRGLI